MKRTTRYLMQHPNGYIYPFTEDLARRKDMSEISAAEAKKRLESQVKGTVIPAPTAVPVDNIDIDGVAEQIAKLKAQRDKALALLGMRPQDLDREEEIGRVIMDEPSDGEAEPDKGAEIEPSSDGEKADGIQVPGPPQPVPPSEMIERLETIGKSGKGKVQIEQLMRQVYGYEVDRREKLETVVEKAIAYIKAQTPQPTKPEF